MRKILTFILILCTVALFAEMRGGALYDPGAARSNLTNIVSGSALAVANGGTGATSAAAGLAALGGMNTDGSNASGTVTFPGNVIVTGHNTLGTATVTSLTAETFTTNKTSVQTIGNKKIGRLGYTAGSPATYTVAVVALASNEKPTFYSKAQILLARWDGAGAACYEWYVHIHRSGDTAVVDVNRITLLDATYGTVTAPIATAVASGTTVTLYLQTPSIATTMAIDFAYSGYFPTVTW